jgi:acyl carrier protein
MTTQVPVPASQELLEDLRRICAETVEIPIGRITVEADLAADLGIDSLTHDELVEAALKRYGLSGMASTIRPASYPTLRALADLVQQLDGEKRSEPDD